jgi:putative selenium metabolism hydrolase
LTRETVSALHQASQSHLPEMIQFLSDIIAIPSPCAQEVAVIQRIRDEMDKLGFDEVWVDGLGNLIGRIGDGKTVIAIDGHVDTVGQGSTAWKRKPFSAELIDGRLYGRGSCDQKGGIVAAVYGAHIAQELGLIDDFSLYIVASVMEEDCEGLNWRFLIEEERLKPGCVLLTEPTNLELCHGHKGRALLEITTHGIAAHGSAPQRGENAISKMGNILKELEALNEQLAEDPVLGRGTLAVTQICSKAPSLNSVPDRCAITIDRRLVRGEDATVALKQLRDLPSVRAVQAEAEIARYQIPSYTGRIYPMEQIFPAWVMPEDHGTVQAARETHQALFGKHLTVRTWAFSTNGAIINGVYGIPCVGFGPGDDRLAHAADEYVPVDHLAKAASFYAAFPIYHAHAESENR